MPDQRIFLIHFHRVPLKGGPRDRGSSNASLILTPYMMVVIAVIMISIIRDIVRDCGDFEFTTRRREMSRTSWEGSGGAGITRLWRAASQNLMIMMFSHAPSSSLERRLPDLKSSEIKKSRIMTTASIFSMTALWSPLNFYAKHGCSKCHDR